MVQRKGVCVCVCARAALVKVGMFLEGGDIFSGAHCIRPLLEGADLGFRLDWVSVPAKR